MIGVAEQGLELGVIGQTPGGTHEGVGQKQNTEHSQKNT